MLIPSDDNIYARVSKRAQASLENKGADAFIYELSPDTGQILSRFRVDTGAGGANIACVHDSKFLSMESKDGAMVPLEGTRVFGSINSSGSAAPKVP